MPMKSTVHSKRTCRNAGKVCMEACPQSRQEPGSQAASCDDAQAWMCLLRLVQRHVKGADKAALPTGTKLNEKQIGATTFCPTRLPLGPKIRMSACPGRAPGEARVNEAGTVTTMVRTRLCSGLKGCHDKMKGPCKQLQIPALAMLLLMLLLNMPRAVFMSPISWHGPIVPLFVVGLPGFKRGKELNCQLTRIELSHLLVFSTASMPRDRFG